MTYPVLETAPPGGRVVKHLTGHRHHHLAQEVVPAEHVGVPDGDPHRPPLHLPSGHHELKHAHNVIVVKPPNCCNDKGNGIIP